MIHLEPLEEPTQPGVYFVEVCQYPSANADSRAYKVYNYTLDAEWYDLRHASLHGAIVYGWYGPLDEDFMHEGEPDEEGYYVAHVQPWPNAAPHVYEVRPAVWRRGEWHDEYGWTKQQGNVIRWDGPFPQLVPPPPWVAQHEKELAEEIGL